MTIEIIIAVMICALIYLIYDQHQSGFTVDKDKMFNDVKNNQEMFHNSDYLTIKEHISWIDAGSYEDIRSILRKGPIDKNKFNIIFRTKV